MAKSRVGSAQSICRQDAIGNNFWTGDRLAGGQTITASANLGTLPIYVRAGAIVPMTAPQQYVDEQPNATVELHIYPGQNGAFQLYEDAGDGYDYEHGAFATINLHWDDAAARLTIGARQRRISRHAAAARFYCRCGQPGGSGWATVDGKWRLSCRRLTQQGEQTKRMRLGAKPYAWESQVNAWVRALPLRRPQSSILPRPPAYPFRRFRVSSTTSRM